MSETPSSTPPTRGHAPLATQVGGHAGVLTSEDGSLIIKPALPVEITFYQSVASDAGFAPLRPFIPKFYGTLKFEGTLETKGKSGTPSGESIVLENLTQTFAKPNILDIKLGTVLYDEDATPEKKARMEKTARQTTSFETGVRITGFQVHDLAAGLAINTAREYGRTLKKDELPSGFARFFPLSSLSSAPQPSSSLSPPSAAPSPPPDAPAVPNLTPADGTGLPPHLLLPILRGILRNVEEIRQAVSEVEMRMVGGSLLVIYEADWERAAEGVRREETGEDLEDGEEGSDDDDDEAAAAGAKVGPPYVVKLIDFAHTFILPGRGPDQSLLTAMDTTVRLLKGRIQEVEATTKP